MTSFGSLRNLPHKLRNLPHKLYEFLKTLIHRYPRIYLTCVTLLALAGYAVVLLFPLLLLAGILNIYDALTASSAIAWQRTSLWFVISITSVLVSYRCTQYKPFPPVGLTLVEDKAPELFRLVQEIRENFKRPVIHRIVITPDYELDIIKTPMWALPVWSKNTMVIGLPVLQCLTARQFKCMVARRLGQFSKRDNRLTNWLYQLRSIWQQYRFSYAKQKTHGIEPLQWFFAGYAPLYTTLSVYAARRDELNADAYAMELFIDEEVRDMITADIVCRRFLHDRYWPAVHKIAAIETKTLPTPHSKMASAVHATLKGEKLAALINEAFEAGPKRRDPAPSLQNRITNIGHEKPYMEAPSGETAATHYLGTSAKGVIDLVDKLWLKTFLESRKIERAQQHPHPVTTQATSM